ncbi:MAG: hypothetical protein L0Y72_27995 [Gemmataceae bacterium]|nr:hypothetical protein [Gemmataceae bacterium]MCI0742890.1 hypothetical protein [Gemmataceae bacterium]
MSYLALEEIRVASPCNASWNEMTGNDRERFCAQCRLTVYNLSDMSREEAEAFLSDRDGKTCIRMFRRSDGTVLTRDCPVGLRALRRHLLWAFAAVAAIFLAVIGMGVTLVLAGGARNHQPGEERIGLVQRLLDIFFARPAPPQLVMGDICPPNPAPPPQAPPNNP